MLCETRGCYWADNRRVHCGECHTTYGSYYSFTRHRRSGWCLPPEDAGMVQRSGVGYTYFDIPRVTIDLLGSIDVQEVS